MICAFSLFLGEGALERVTGGPCGYVRRLGLELALALQKIWECSTSFLTTNLGTVAGLGALCQRSVVVSKQTYKDAYCVTR